MKNLLLLFALLLIAGCSTDPVAYKDAHAISEQNLLKGYAKYSEQKDGSVRVIIVRDSGIITGNIILSINGDPIANFESSADRLELFMMPDDYVFGLVRDIFLQPNTTYEKEVLLKSGRSYAYRIFLENRLGMVSVSLMPSALLQ